MAALQVASKDTVLYTAQNYVVRCTRFGSEQRAHAQQLLAPLIRCPHLPRYWLAGSADSDQAHGRVLSELRPHLRRLLKLLDAQPSCIVEVQTCRGGPAGRSTTQLGSGAQGQQASQQRADGVAGGGQRAAQRCTPLRH